ncbi:ASST-domain-containing protein [Aspergillus caelatus]|uniref:ASST-domain-containing protein n=1 Tax=Aspergillus caelatus TaxID=61420 RepID=A0A5N7AB70_9EURO|nr:ASST-domain-containing protein [Aspergillus caelatus]KAE8366406.1 ASST-domain-containing protein [Aspergillus caelatus]
MNEEREDQKHQPNTSTDFHPGHITQDTFQALLACYPATLDAVTRRKATDRVLRASSTRGKRAKRSRQVSPPSQVENPALDEEQKKQVEAEVGAFRELDALRYEGLPGVVVVAEKRCLEKEEVVKLVEWKLKHGIFRPALLGMVKSNQAKAVQKATSDAFTAVNTTRSAKDEAEAETGDKPETTDPTASFPKSSLDALMKPLRGVGIATASLLLSVGTIRDPEHEAPFYSDHTYLWLCMKEFPGRGTRLSQESEKTEVNKLGKKAGKLKPNGEINVKYDVSEYRSLWAAVNELRARLNETESSLGKVSCADIEKVAFVLRYIDVSGYLEQYDIVDDDLQPADEGPHEAEANPGIKREGLDKEEKGGRNTLTWHSLLYDTGLLGAHPRTKYESFDLASPEPNILKWDPRCEDKYVFFSPRGHFYPHPGPLIFDNKGNLVWMESRFGMVMDFRVQRYRGEDYLTFWTGEDDGTRGLGRYYMLDKTYTLTHTITPTNNLRGDVHEFQLTSTGTALITIYEIIPYDLTPINGSQNGWIYDCLFQEIDIETGSLLFQWRASDHYNITETYFPLEEGKGMANSSESAYDYFHINSVDKLEDGRYLVSSRYMHTVTCVGGDGEVLWVLGGKRNMFRNLEEGLDVRGFKWQHNAKWVTGSSGDVDVDVDVDVITVFDNGANDHVMDEDHSRGLVIAVDVGNWTATLKRVYDAPGGFSAHSQGNVQVLEESGNVFVGWGKAAAYTEFSAGGEVLCDTHWGPQMFFPLGWVKSYRTYKAGWVGRPVMPPDVAVDGGLRTVFVSWNGATDVAGWVLQRVWNSTEDEFETVDYVPKTGFETAIEMDERAGSWRLVAVDFTGEELGYTEVFSLDHSDSWILSSALAGDDGLLYMLIPPCMVGAALAALWQTRKRIAMGLRYLASLRARQFY